MKQTLLFLSTFFVLSLGAQTFYDINTIQKIEITFTQSNWDQLLDNEKAGSENYIMAKSISINGQTFDSVGVKYKGNSTYNSRQTKNPFHIELNTYKDNIYEAYTDIKLSNVAKDPSFLREVLSYQILRQYMDAPLSNYANVYVNGNLIGLYSNSEAVSKKFVNNRFGSKKNTFVKCNPPAGAGPGTSDYPNLVYLGTDSSKYYKAYELKSTSGWDELIHLCDTLSNSLSSIDQILDVDRALWMLAFNNVLVNLDSYSGGFAQNYYLYRHNNQQFMPVVWDLNESFGQFAMSGSGNLNTTAAKQSMSHLLHENDANYPLIKQLLSIPMYKRMYLAHMKTMLQENFANKKYFTQGKALQTIIDAAVQADGNKFYTYANFTANLSSDISSGGPGPGRGSTPGIANLMDARSTYLLGLTDFTNTQPTISKVSLSDSTPALKSTVNITATVTDENSVYLGHRSSINDAFTRVAMFDDGAHNDGAANDGVYGASLLVSSLSMQYYIYAENSNIGMFSPQRAEYEYHAINAAGDLVINELGASNQSVVKNKDGNYSDWIELYNNGSSSINLGDYYLSDDSNDSTKWKLPNENILPGKFKLIWASGDTTADVDHANFKLSKSGEEVGLYKKNGSQVEPVDYIGYPAQVTDYSYGRESDANPNWIEFKIPTPNESNIIKTPDTSTVSTFDLDKESSSAVQFYPNPYSNKVTFKNQYDVEATISIYSSTGALLHAEIIPPMETIEWNDSNPGGLRIVRVQSAYSSYGFRLISR